MYKIEIWKRVQGVREMDLTALTQEELHVVIASLQNTIQQSTDTRGARKAAAVLEKLLTNTAG